MKLLSKAFLDERLVPELEGGTVQYFDHMRRYLFAQQYVAGRRVLDIACGTGYGGDVLRRGGARQVIGMDISREAVAYAERRWKAASSPAHFVQADANRLPLSDGSLDVIVSFETLEHLAEPRRFLDEAKRILASDGALIVSTPNRAIASPGSATPYSPYHAFEPTLAEFQTLFESSGWRVRALHGISHSARAAALVHPARAPFTRQMSQIAWTTYIRRWVLNILPPLIYQALSRRRHIPQLDIADSILTETATEGSSYFVAVLGKRDD
ncbi:MAG: class I SAM-dependent methyltransferase [Aggregatilineales bacterium]